MSKHKKEVLLMKIKIDIKQWNWMEPGLWWNLNLSLSFANSLLGFIKNSYLNRCKVNKCSDWLVTRVPVRTFFFSGYKKYKKILERSFLLICFLALKKKKRDLVIVSYCFFLWMQWCYNTHQSLINTEVLGEKNFKFSLYLRQK